jgi:hypothetical protein
VTELSEILKHGTVLRLDDLMGVPASACRNAYSICSSVYLFRFIGPPIPEVYISLSLDSGVVQLIGLGSGT